MRLLIFSPYFPPHIGGVEGYVRDLNEELVHLDLVDAITVLAPRIPMEGSPLEQLAADYLVVRYPGLDTIPNFPCPAPWRRGFWRLLRVALRSRSHDVVICHTRFFLSSLAALLYSKATGIPLIHVEHGSGYVHMTSRVQSAIARLYDMSLGRLVLRHANAVVAVSQAAASFVRELSGREAQVIYRSVDHQRYDLVDPCPAMSSWAAGRSVVLFVGRLIDGKGVADLVEAFAQLDDPGVALCIVGDGPRRAELEVLCKERGLDDSCRFMGYQPEERTLALMRAADLIVNPSYTEGLPTSVLEAALLGRAILASDVGGTPEIVAHGRSAILLPAGDIGALCRGLKLLIADPAMRVRLGRAAREDAIDRFDGGTSARRFISLTHYLVEGSVGLSA